MLHRTVCKQQKLSETPKACLMICHSNDFLIYTCHFKNCIFLFKIKVSNKVKYGRNL